MKYRIVVASSLSDYPYRVEKKNDGYFSFWHEIAKYSSLERAERELPELADKHNKIPKSGTILKIYTQEDLLIDKLNGKLQAGQDNANLTQSAIGTTSMSVNNAKTSNIRKI